MFPHERSLVTKLKNKPFVLLGVNTDKDVNDFKANLKKHSINWRSWQDGSTSGPICKKYRVNGFPTLFLIDHKGVIRYKWEGAPNPVTKIDEAILELLKEAEGEQKDANKPAKIVD
jgi:hypothetical protein